MLSFKRVLFTLIPIFLMFFAVESTLTANPPSEPAFVKEFLGQADFVEGRLTQLAEAMPEGTYGWRPGEGVRSVGEVYLHVAFGNYIWVTMSGGKVPEDVGFVPDPAKMGEWDTQTTNKA